MIYIFQYEVVPQISKERDFLDMIKQQYVLQDAKFVNADEEPALLTSYDVVYRYEDKHENLKDWIASYVGQSTLRDETGYVGKWPDDSEIDHLHYYVDKDSLEIFKMFITEQIGNSLSMTSLFNTMYFIEQDGKMISVTPQQGDMMADTLEDARAIQNYFRQSK